ncbi:MAG: aminodeoxychorismate synthase component I [Phycisphaerae bacterium]|nr:aminodeoxychorismate synthase component I [Phycisphaerae bacterium]
MPPRPDASPPLAPTAGPAALLAAWPADLPLAMLAWHGGGSDGPGRTFAASPVQRTELRGPNALQELRTLLSSAKSISSTPHGESADGDLVHGPGGKGFFVMLGYDLFRQLESTAIAAQGAVDDRGWPDAILLRCEGGLLATEGAMRVRGDAAYVPRLTPRRIPRPSIGTIATDRSPDEYRAMVADVVTRIRRGDCFQANIAQRFGARFRGSVRAVAAAAFEAAIPRHGALLECGPGRAVVSMSPELFLEARPRRSGIEVRTRPIKGTRPASVPPGELLRSEKDAAELAMIVDLMRNDLGRVCRIGSVEVAEARRIESHPTVHHGVAEIRGILRPDADLVDLLEASFPPGSITGAPKIQAMRIIDELESVRRGPYCGAVGWIGDDGMMSLNVAIRTICCQGVPLARADELDGRLDYHAGCGIVADSEPDSEYRESLDKTEVFRRTLARLASKA